MAFSDLSNLLNALKSKSYLAKHQDESWPSDFKIECSRLGRKQRGMAMRSLPSDQSGCQAPRMLASNGVGLKRATVSAMLLATASPQMRTAPRGVRGDLKSKSVNSEKKKGTLISKTYALG